VDEDHPSQPAKVLGRAPRLHDLDVACPALPSKDALMQLLPPAAWELDAYSSMRFTSGRQPQGPQGASLAELKGPRAQAAGRQLRLDPSNPKGVPEMLPRYLPKAEHARLATQLVSPYQRPPVMADDLAFAVEATACLGAGACSWRHERVCKLREIAEALCPISARFYEERAQAGGLPQPVVRIHVAFLAFLVELLQWPDALLAASVGAGARIVGQVRSTGVFRPAPLINEPKRGELLKDAAAWVDSLQRAPKLDKLSDEVWRLTLQEVEENLARGPFSRHDLDLRFGRGGWRPMRRFGLQQALTNKVRCIDDASESGHNAATAVPEQIHTQSIDTVIAVVRAMGAHLEGDWHKNGFDWSPIGGTDDHWKAFRQHPVAKEDEMFSIAAVVNPHTGEYNYFIIDGLPFGVAAAVPLYNSVSEFIEAVARRVLALPCVKYFDDFCLCDHAMNEGSAQDCLWHLHYLLGFRLDLKKRQPMAPSFVFLGSLIDLTEVASLGIVSVRLKPGRADQLEAEVNAILSRGSFPAAHAAKMRGTMPLFNALLYLLQVCSPETVVTPPNSDCLASGWSCCWGFINFKQFAPGRFVHLTRAHYPQTRVWCPVGGAFGFHNDTVSSGAYGSERNWTAVSLGCPTKQAVH
jgi:hypothetical protein